MKQLNSLFLIAAAVLSTQVLAAAQDDALVMSVNNVSAELDNPIEEREMLQDFSERLSKGTGSKIKLVYGTNSTNELQRTRTGYYDIIAAPAHVIGSAVKHGYQPLARMQGSNKAQFISLKSSGITKLDQAKGKRLCMPQADSLATYLASGVMNANGIKTKSYFSKIDYARYNKSCLYFLENNLTDVVAVTADSARKWMEKGLGVVILESSEIPNISVAISEMVPDASKEKLRQTLLAMKQSSRGLLLTKLHVEGFEPASNKDFDYVSTLGYYTPTVLPGVTRVSATTAKELMGKGVSLIDTRVEHEYKESRITGAISIPYQEKSAKEIDFDPSLDKFAVDKLPKDKNTQLIFACNGAECWKSYKASVLALKNGYSKVYWFRGGFPEWKGEGFPVESGEGGRKAAK